MNTRLIKNSLFYTLIIGSFSVLIYWIIQRGAHLEEGRNIVAAVSGKGAWIDFCESLKHNLEHPLATLLAQILTIIVVARLLGWVCKKIGQPSVIGEIIAGIMLGPSLLGLHFPELSAALFPAKSLGNLQFLSQIGLILFMFVVGMEIDLKVLRNKAHDAFVISHASIIIPFALGIGLAYYIYGTFAPEGVKFSSFGLFMGIAMSITAFPVLARIVQERGINKTRLGTIVITCAAADDITAWCILAAVIAIVKAGSFVSSLYVIALAIAYVFIMLKVIRPFLKRIGDLHSTRENMNRSIVGIFFLTMILSAYVSEVIGIHALFGAFLAGAIMPENARFRNVFIEKVEDVSLVLLLPLFFVFTGLRTQIGLLNDPGLWTIAVLIIVVGVVGKFVGSALAARLVGQNWKDSLSIGALMNTRGLMELVVLNIGYDLGVLNPAVFAMMVIMALVTTFMTGPALDLINRLFKDSPTEAPVQVKELGKYKILFSFGSPQTGKNLFLLANSLSRKMKANTTLTAMHLSPVNDLNQYNIEEYEKESFTPVIDEAHRLDQQLITLFKASKDIEADIAVTANNGHYDLLLIGLGQSIFEGSLLGRVLGFTTRIIDPEKLINTVTGKARLSDPSSFEDRTRSILSRAHIPVGILIDKNLEEIGQVFLPVFTPADAELVEYAQKLIHNVGAQVTILDVAGHIKANSGIRERIRAIEQNAPNHIMLLNERPLESSMLQHTDLIIMSLESWKAAIDAKSEWLGAIPSALVISGK